ncbi:MAG: IscS subfamily cysteine desulfurase [Clostridia bacterium]|nr:IscS subfamily cysteine desulfurase [Clostridia bacterium]
MELYLDCAATTKMSRRAIDAMLPYMEEVYGNPSSLYSIGQKAKEALENARERVAACIGAKAREIYFTSGGSEADNQAIISAALNGAKKGKKHIVSTAFEHHAVLHTLKKLEKQGYEVTYLPVGEKGIVDVADAENAVRDDTCLVTVMYANNEIGTVQPIREIGEMCRKKGVVFHTDAVQVAGHIPVDVVRDSVDMLSVSAHKFRGPKGVGALYVRQGVLLNSLIEGGAQERGKRAGTENVAGIMGMTAALEEAVQSMDSLGKATTESRDRLIAGLRSIPYSSLNGDEICRLPGNVSFCFEGIEGESLLLMLDDLGISASSGSACTSGSLDPSHVLLAIGRVHEVAHGSLRLTFDRPLSDAEIAYTVDSVKGVVERLRSMSPLWHDLENGRRAHIFKEFEK